MPTLDREVREERDALTAEVAKAAALTSFKEKMKRKHENALDKALKFSKQQNARVKALEAELVAAAAEREERLAEKDSTIERLKADVERLTPTVPTYNLHANKASVHMMKQAQKDHRAHLTASPLTKRLVCGDAKCNCASIPRL